MYQKCIPINILRNIAKTLKVSNMGPVSPTYCSVKDSKEIYDCDAMDHSLPEEIRSCRVCPGKCSWKKHWKEEIKHDYVQKEQTTTSGAIRQKYESKLGRSITWVEVMDALKMDIAEKKKDLVALVETFLRHIRQRRKLAFNPRMQCVEAGRFVNDVIVYLIGIEQMNQNGRDRAKRIDALQKLGQLTSPYTEPRDVLEANEQSRGPFWIPTSPSCSAYNRTKKKHRWRCKK